MDCALMEMEQADLGPDGPLSIREDSSNMLICDGFLKGSHTRLVTVSRDRQLRFAGESKEGIWTGSP